MADNAKSKTLVDGPTRATVLLSCSSDGTGETAAQKIDISALNMAANRVKIVDMKWSIGAMTCEILFDHNTDDTAAILAGNGHLSERHGHPPILDPASAGGTGDILLTSKVTASTVGNGYTILITVEKVS